MEENTFSYIYSDTFILDSSGMTMWNTVNNWEMYHVFEKVCEDLGDKRKVVVLGGTNNGPAVTNVCPEVREKFPRNFRIAGNNGKNWD